MTVRIDDPNRAFGEHVYQMLDGYSDEPNPWLPGEPTPRWAVVTTDGSGAEAAQAIPARIEVPRGEAHRLFQLLEPGATLYVTDAPAGPESRTGPDFTILATSEPLPDEEGREEG